MRTIFSISNITSCAISVSVYVHTKQNYAQNAYKIIRLEKKTAHNYFRVMGSVWVLFLLSAHTRPIFPTYFAGSPYTARITASISHIKCSLILYVTAI